jgi:hypothetical protein
MKNNPNRGPAIYLTQGQRNKTCKNYTAPVKKKRKGKPGPKKGTKKQTSKQVVVMVKGGGPKKVSVKAPKAPKAPKK